MLETALPEIKKQAELKESDQAVLKEDSILYLD